MNPGQKLLKTEQPGGTSRNRILVSYLLIVTALAGLAGCGGKNNATGQKGAAPVVPVFGVLIETVRSAALPETSEVTGTVKARVSAVISSRVAGTVSAMRVREGERVKKGFVLAQLDAQENQAAAAAAAAACVDAQHGLEEAHSRKKLADTTFERYQKLFNEQAVTRQEFDVKQAERDLASAGVLRAGARLTQLRESSRAAAATAGYTRIVAPLAGIVRSKSADIGSTVFPSQPLMTIEDEGSYQLELAIPESMMGTVKVGTAVLVTIDAAGSTFAAKIAEIIPAADPGSRTFTAKINTAQKGLGSGMFGRAVLTLGSSVTSLMVKKKAIVEHGALTSVWTIGSDNIARLRLVRVGKTTGERVEILSGLSDGERVVIGGVERVSEGVRVE